ncbi:MAG: ligase-associated DNA damage response DEXH box helicase [Herminiimonas sp.]|nr:ligase-associated DNA damage response DEXH box helicase [Herminiimonas sp.]
MYPATTTTADWFAVRGWKIFPFQRTVWKAALQGKSGLLHATTGSGKTYAVWFAALQRSQRLEATQKQKSAGGIRVLWITPMRALAADTLRALQAPAADLMPHWTIGARTGDTASAERARQARMLPAALVTTPESLSLMLSKADAAQQCRQLDMVIVDEWHELLGSKRGVQVQLALARLRQWRPALVVWGLSATLGNLRQAQDALLGVDAGTLVEGGVKKALLVDTLIPVNPSRFPWGGHLGIQMLQPVIDEIERHQTTLVFTNTRSQAEIWYQNMLAARPDWAGLIALHHGSLDKAVREWVELGLKRGALKAVICTSSLDLGVDFLPVERVLQIGSAKGVARLLQRAGRSGHAPGRVSRVTLVPTNTMELLEAAGAQTAIAARNVESRLIPDKPLDVLVQHLVTVALGGGFTSDALYAEVKSAYAYRDLSPEEWQWALDFVARGGQSLTVYPEYRRVLMDEEGVYRVPDAAIGRRHRMGIGTIVSDATMSVKYLSGSTVGSVEESFISRMHKGDHFLFGGRILEFIRVHEMTAYVKRATGSKGAVPRWQGGKMPMSSELAHAVLARLEDAVAGRFSGPEMQAVKPLLEVQQRWSGLPTSTRLVLETTISREGQHLFVYPFAGRAVHMGLASLLAYRMARRAPATFSIAINDYGFELLSATPVDWRSALAVQTSDSNGNDNGNDNDNGIGKSDNDDLLASSNLLEDVLASLNAAELSQRRFREIARIAGLIFQGYPGQPKSARQLQASSSLFFQVFRQHDAANLLLTQAQREVLEQELELGRLRATLVELQGRSREFHETRQATPFAFPLMVERFREKLTSEKLSDRVARMVRELEKAAAL